jgi:hypothetical protein
MLGPTICAAFLVGMAAWTYREHDRAVHGSYKNWSRILCWVIALAGLAAHFLQVLWPSIIGLVAFIVQFNLFHSYQKQNGSGENLQPHILTLLGVLFIGWTLLTQLRTETPVVTEYGTVELRVKSWWGLEKKAYPMGLQTFPKEQYRDAEWYYSDDKGRRIPWQPASANDSDPYDQ